MDVLGENRDGRQFGHCGARGGHKMKAGHVFLGQPESNPVGAGQNG